MTPSIRINRSYQKTLKKCLVLYIGVFLCMHRPGITAGAKCGRPGRNTMNVYEPSGNEFNENDRIRYLCTEKDHVILGDSERECLKDGSWSNEIPVCSKVATLESVELMFQDSEKEKAVTVDKNISTCSEASKYNSTIWRGYLPTSVNISAVQITILGMREVDIDVTVQEEDPPDTKKCRFKSIDAELSIKSTKTLTFYCPTSTVGKYVHISCNCQSLRFCEVSVLLPPVSSCLAPDIPFHGLGFKRVSEDVEYQFSCDPGYKIWGSVIVTCQTDGRWLPKSPVCDEIYCLSPEKIENGYVEYTLNKGRVPYNGTATYSCKEGYNLEGKSIIRCHRWHNWDSIPPTCKPRISFSAKDVPFTDSWRQSNVTHCGSLPHIANGALIVNSSNIGSTAWLKCSEGFKPLTDNRVSCLSTGEWSSRSLHCTIIRCEANPVIPHGKAILLNNSTYYGSHLEIKCNQGYTSHTLITRKCNENGTWGDLNICIEITCGAHNSNEDGHDQWLSVNGSVSLRVLICPEDFHIEGSPAVIRCLSNGSWSYTSAKCKKPFLSPWGSNWTPSLILIAAVAAGVGTALVILCLSVAFLVIKKRRQANTNTTVFHLENVSQKDRMREAAVHRPTCHSETGNYNMVERRVKSAGTNSRKPRSALPNLPVDADPVYAQPFETATAAKKVSISTGIKKEKDDLYNTHIYAEPVNSRRQTPTHIAVNITNPRMGNDRRSSVEKTNFGTEPPISIPIEQQNCDKNCAIYDSSRNSGLNCGQLITNETYQSCDERTEFSTLTLIKM